jgi:hypothetical protein
VVRLTPALAIEHYFETFCGLARDGKAAKNGLPRNPLQLAVLGNEFRDEITFPPPAQIVGGLLMAALAVGWASGASTRHTPTTHGRKTPPHRAKDIPGRTVDKGNETGSQAVGWGRFQCSRPCC